MLELRGYLFVEKIYETQRTLIFSGKRVHDGLPVTIKILATDNPGNQEISQFEYEYKIGSMLKTPDVPVYYSLENYGASRAIVFESIDGKSLDFRLADGAMSIGEFLPVAVKLAKALGDIHKKQIIHKDIKPQNVIYNRDNQLIKIIDFSIASRVKKEVKNAVNPDRLEGTLSYISPEQTGRMNRSVDFRSDFYSLGVTFYQMLTGKLPFSGSDAMEIVHAHMAIRPSPLNEINPEVPSVLSDIVLKLMSKTPEERYQSAAGLLADLRECRDQFEKKGKIDPFRIGTHDESGIFQIPEKLYGREKETAVLFEEFGKVSRGNTGIVFFDGISGSGKSFLINEIQKPLVMQRGYFVSGKFDQFKKNIPFSAVIQAFQDMIRQILTESQERVEKWKSDLLQALGENGQVVVDVVPSLELVIGKQPPAVKLEAAEAQNRFNYVFQIFIKVFARKEHPLVLFLDDLQWADMASLKWLDMTLKDKDLGYFLFIGSYRNNEVNTAHPLQNIFENLKKTNRVWQTIHLGSLGNADISRMIQDTLRIEEESARGLADVVKTKTDGNPLFVNEYLKSLYSQEFIVFDGGWKWDLEKIRNAKISDNVVEFMADKIRQLPKDTLALMKQASCMGVRIYLDTFSQICGKDDEEMFHLFKIAVDEGMLIKQEDRYLFAHDRIQEAVYSLLDAETKTKTHYDIGMQLLRHNTPEKVEEALFSVVHQLDMGSSLIVSKEEKMELVRLNLRAAQKAKASTAYDAAERYLKTSENLLPENPWKTEYDLKLLISIELGEMYYMLKNYQAMEEYFASVLKNARNYLDKSRIYELKIVYNTDVLKFEDGFNAAMEAFRYFGIRIPRKVNPLHLLTELMTVKMRLGKKNIESLENLPEMKNEKYLAAMRLLMAFTTLSYLAYPDHMPIGVFKMFKLSLKYGNSYFSCFSYLAYGGVINNALGEITDGNRFGRLALKVLEKYNARALKSKIAFVYYNLIHTWEAPLRQSVPYLFEAYQAAKENGDLLYVIYCLFNGINNQILYGENLFAIRNLYIKYFEEIRLLNNDIMFQSNMMYYQFIFNMTEKTDDKTRLIGTMGDENYSRKLYEENHQDLMLAYLYSLKQILSVIYNDFDQCVSSGEKNVKHLGSALGMPIVLVHYFYYTFGLLVVMQGKTVPERGKYLKIVRKNQKKLKFWAKFAPENVQHKYLLTEAERQRLYPEEYLPHEVLKVYDQSIALAHKSEFLHEEAIACERAGRYCLKIGLTNAASPYITTSYNAYMSWGAVIKAKDLREEFPEYILSDSRTGGVKPDNRFSDTTMTSTVSHGGASTTVNSITTTQSQFLDLATVMKASGAISGEIVMEKLYSRLLKILMENVGADKSVLVIAKEDGLYVEAQADSSNREVTLLKSMALHGSDRVPESLVNYVARTGISVVIKDASEDSEYMKDSYIWNNKPKSVLCAPILNQNRLTGVLYLENSMASGAFTPERLQVLKMLGGQIGISLENAKLYEKLEDYSKNLEQKVKDRTRELDMANHELQKKQDLMTNELNVAKRVQLTLVPQEKKLPRMDGLEFGAHYVPMEDIGGDMYDVVEIDDHTIGFLIADVSGHGVPSALITTMLKAAYSYNAKPGRNASEIAFAINEEMVKLIGDLEHYFTAFYGIYDRKTGKFSYSNAGHHPAMHYRAGTGELIQLDTDGTIVGKFPGLKYGSGEIRLEAGDGVLFYTDGIVEARNADDDFYGIGRLQEIYRKAANTGAAGLVQALMGDLEKYCGNAPADDDRTILYVKVK